MRIAIYQCEPRPGQVDHNLERLARSAKHASTEGVDLLICPEMYLTGYNIGVDAVRELAESSDGTSAHAVAEMAGRTASRLSTDTRSVVPGTPSSTRPSC